MKKIFAILISLSGIHANATNYYFASSGSDGNRGTSTGSPWQSIAKYNATAFATSDHIYFKRGDVFYGSLKAVHAGVVVDAYGTGANPIITGFTSVTSWTDITGNIWESTSAVSKLSYCNMVVVNGVNTPMGRYPNSSWLNVDSHSGSTITSSSLSGLHTGAELVIKPYVYVIDRLPISGQSGTTLTYGGSISSSPTDGLGFFIQNEASVLDVQGEWYYNPSTKKLRIYSVGMPTGVQLTTLDTLALVNGSDNVTIQNIDFIGSNMISLAINFSTNCTVSSCSFNFAGIDAFRTIGRSCNNIQVTNCSVNHTNNNAIFLGGKTGATVTGNTIENSGVIPGMGQGGGETYSAIITHTSGSTVSNNNIDSCGYSGIEFYGSDMTISDNLIQHHCIAKIDGGAIYTYAGNDSHSYSNQIISNNIILYGLGDIAGTNQSTPISYGIYIDDGSHDVTVAGNTIAHGSNAGIYIHNASNIDMQNNILFDNASLQFQAISVFATGYPIRNMNFKHNILVAKTRSQKVMIIMSTTDDLSSLGTLDSNYLARPIDDNVTIQSSINGYTTITDRTLSGWKSYSGYDVHSRTSPKGITDVNDCMLVYNATSSTVTKSISNICIDMASNSFNGTITLPPYSSAILLKMDK